MNPFEKALAPSLAVALVATALTTPSALAQTQSDGTLMRLQRIQGAIEVDGRLTESAWSQPDTAEAQASPADATMRRAAGRTGRPPQP